MLPDRAWNAWLAIGALVALLFAGNAAAAECTKYIKQDMGNSTYIEQYTSCPPGTTWNQIVDKYKYVFQCTRDNGVNCGSQNPSDTTSGRGACGWVQENGSPFSDPGAIPGLHSPIFQNANDGFTTVPSGSAGTSAEVSEAIMNKVTGLVRREVKTVTFYCNGCSCPNQCSLQCTAGCADNLVCQPGFTRACVPNSGGTIPQCIGTPILLDVDGTGWRLTSFREGVKVKVLPNSDVATVGWTVRGSRNAWLFLDRNNNGQLDDFTELFGANSPQEKSAEPNGFQALAIFDQPSEGGNGNGRIDEGDRVFSQLRGWIDEDHSGTIEPRELYTLPVLRISAIGLTFAHAPLFDSAGNLYKYFGRVWDSDGRPKQAVVDVFLGAQPIFQFPHSLVDRW